MTKRSYPELYRGKYEPIPYDDSWREPMWERVERELGGDERAKDIVAAFKELYTMYTDDLVEWYANLYDPNLGGYYCTTSGKENEGFLPDIESTVMALRFLEHCGLLDHMGNDWKKAISDEMKAKLVKFAKRMQEPNGYFYNFLKTREEIDAAVPKRGRDLGWCTSVLSELGSAPTYDTPNGYKGDGIDYMGNRVVSEVAVSAAEDKPAAALNPGASVCR